MKTSTRLAAALLGCLGSAAWAAYTYYYSDSLSSVNTSNWYQNGSVSTGSSGLTSSSNGALISKVAVPGGTSFYEVRTVLNLTTSGGYFLSYLRASSDSLTGQSGTFYASEIANPTFSGGSCSATASILKSISNSVTVLSSTTVPCHSGMEVRTLITVYDGIMIYIDGHLWLDAWDTAISSGQPGIGVFSAPAGNTISIAQLGPITHVNPTIDSQLINASPFPNRVDMQWSGAITLDPNGTQVAFYWLGRNDVGELAYIWDSNATQIWTYTDTTASPGTNYTYTLYVYDMDWNYSSVSFNVTTPPSGAIDPRQVGVRPLGTYWGYGGEKIDMRSGNLNYTLPLVKAMGRGGWSVGFSLSYNSENWRQDSGGIWQLGHDIGYGFGWRLQAGSLLPVYTSWGWSVDHYLYIDATGAEYRLNTNTNGVWTSEEGIYVYYDSNANLLHFRDGSFWALGCVSAGTEQDGGTLYPTLMEDSNGNQVSIAYNDGLETTFNNSSSRISTITDVRQGYPATYSFTYNTDSIPHLTSITNSIETSENYSFGYISSYTLTEPFTGQSHSYGTYSMLDCANSVTIPGSTTFAYDGAASASCQNTSGGSGPGELTLMTTPYGAHIRWPFTSFTYSNNRTYREIYGDRYLATSSGATETAYWIWLTGSPNLPFHTESALDDPDGNGEKAWAFYSSDPTQPYYALGMLAESRPHHFVNGNVPGTHSEYYYYTTNSSNNPYISMAQIIEDNYNPTSVTKTVTQTLDQYGNMTQMAVYNWNVDNGAARTYTNTYLSGSNYASNYIFNRLASSTVTNGTNTTTLAQNYYDGYGLTGVSGITMHDSNFSTAYIYRGNVTTSTTPNGTTTTSYDIGGNVTSTTVNGVTTSISTGSSTNWAAPTEITTNSLSSSMSWNSFLGLNSATGPNGDTLSLGYGGTERPTSSTSPYGAITYYTYVDYVPVSKTATTNNHWVKTTVDGFGRTVETDTGYGTTTVSIVTNNYISCGCSPIGKMNQTSQPYAPGGTAVYTTHYYDGLGRTTSLVAPDGSTTSYLYSGNTVTVTDPSGNWKIFSMDVFGNLTQVQEPDPTLGTVSTNYTYDILSHLIQVSMPRGSNTQTRTFNYTNGTTVGALLLSATNPENGTVSYTYNTDMTLATKTDAKGQVFSYSYDNYKRLTQVSVGGNLLRTYSYDTNPYDSSYSQYSAGRLTAIQYPAVNYVPSYQGPQASTGFTDMFSYNPAGQIAGKTLMVTKTQAYQQNGSWYTQYATGNLELAYAYNNEGKVTSVTYPIDSVNGTPTYNYSHDSMMRLNGMTGNDGGAGVTNVGYNQANQMTSMNYYGATETRTYNSLLQMTNITTSINPGFPENPINVTYNYPAGSNNGKIGSLSDAISSETVTYQYDSLNRLISAAGSGWTQTQAYDAFGNLTSRTGTGTAQSTTISTPANPATNQLTGYTYDANGNQISTGYTYDAENRIVYANAGANQYGYDAQNKRIWQATCGNNSYGCYIGTSWILNSETITMFGADGKQIATYVPSVAWNNSQTLLTINFTGTWRAYFGGKLVSQFSNGYMQPEVQDRLGSVGKYYPYGEERNSPPLANDQVKFATYTRDSATGNDYADQRYYASMFGRFMTSDPGWKGTVATRPSSWNRYSYVEGDPANNNDPRGRFLPAPSPQPPVPDPEPAPQIPGLQYPITYQVPQNFTPSLTPLLGIAVVAFESSFLQGDLNAYLNTLQSQNSPCLSQLESLTGDSFSQIEAAGNATQYFDLSSTAVAQLTFADVGISWPGASPQQSLTTYVYNTNPSAANFDALVYQGPYVFLSSSFWNNYSAAQIGGSTIYLSSPTTLLQQQQTLFHELWHELGIGDLGGSQAFGDWLDHGCKGPPPGPPQ